MTEKKDDWDFVTGPMRQLPLTGRRRKNPFVSEGKAPVVIKKRSGNGLTPEAQQAVEALKKLKELGLL